MSTAVIENIRHARAERQERREHAYLDMARRIAGGETVTPDEADAVLNAAGRTPDELDAEVATWRSRYAAAPLLGEEAALRTELPNVYTEAERLKSDYLALGKKYELANWQASDRYRAIQRRLKEIDSARRTLEATCSPRAKATLTATRAKLRECREALSTIRSRMSDLAKQIAYDKSQRADLEARNMLDGRHMQLGDKILQLENERQSLEKKVAPLLDAEQVAMAEVADAETTVFTTK